MSKYYPPIFKQTQFNCIHCGVFSKQHWEPMYTGIRNLRTGSEISGISLCHCSHCDRFTFWYGEKMIVPTDSVIEPAHSDMPEEIKGEYDEARAIFGRSPRAAAALLRLAIQKLMPLIGGKGNKINDDIKNLVLAGLPVQVQQALDYCRVVGNNAVHPGEINLNDTPEVAVSLFDMINFIVDDRISKPKKIAELYGKLPQKAQDAIAERDNP